MANDIDYAKVYTRLLDKRSASLATEREWTGLYWRCVVTASDADGSELAKAASGAVGPIEAQDAKVKGAVHHPEPMRVGKTLSVELELPDGAEALVCWMRAPRGTASTPTSRARRARSTRSPMPTWGATSPAGWTRRAWATSSRATSRRFRCRCSRRPIPSSAPAALFTSATALETLGTTATTATS